ncbi:uncharacterized protein LOC123922215 [Trifolium pratense]|uniref:uncharacterized protein LOC123892214 n=1 Tax=Trifolium pratense TaxID=57577 RepID=UPI001E690BCC|nr:uncharacterized protein LOC123892214 [Trifolium pratense]XP_045802770.1 uncharacterized protein LOC123896429 [Trifolium pratense]XP_045815475.1 uncharacterized protein LOC123908788 [Trifolium pratense]XP_045830913.1 uncharacterized protein LOC123922215 [Trifolium pratense]
MAENVVEVMQRPALSYFMTVHVKGEVEAEVEREFYREYKNELGNVWRLYDFNYNSKCVIFEVEFSNYDDVPKITNGWMTLRTYYEFDSHHQIFFKYLGTNQFQIIPSFNRITPDQFPTWHSKSRSLRKAVSFTMTITEDAEIDPELTLPREMGEYLWYTMLDEVTMIGANGEKYKCSLRYQRNPFVVTIWRGWPEVVGINGFKVGDRIQFNTYNIYEDHAMTVRSIS